MHKKMKVVVSGINGRMGRFAARTVINHAEFELVGACGRATAPYVGRDVGELIGGNAIGVLVVSTFQETLQAKPDLVLDFTRAETAFAVAKQALTAGVRPVIGTSGLPAEEISILQHIAAERNLGAMVVPNFSIGAVLMIEFARQSGAFFSHCEIVEMHHTKKLDAPSGTALYTAAKLGQLGCSFNQCRAGLEERELTPGARGSHLESGIRVHSLRLPGLIAHQEVIYAGEGELFSIKHETINQECLVPGIVMALRAVLKSDRLTVGLDSLVFGGSIASDAAALERAYSKTCV